MSSNSETGHAKNLDNAKLFIDIATTFGVAYNPANADLTVGNLTIKWKSATDAQHGLTALAQAADHPINERQAAFKEADRLVKRSFYFYESSSTSKAAIEDARGLKVRFTGSNIRRPKDENGAPLPGYISNSHQSFSQKAETFRQLCDLYAADPKYVPNESDLTISALNDMADRLHDLNNAMGTVVAPVIAAKGVRDEELYEPEIGLVDRVLAAKKYVRALYGPNSHQYNSVKGIKFSKPKS